MLIHFQNHDLILKLKLKDLKSLTMTHDSNLSLRQSLNLKDFPMSKVMHSMMLKGLKIHFQNRDLILKVSLKR